MQEVSCIYTFLFLDTDYLNMTLRARKVSGAFEKRAPAYCWDIFVSPEKVPILKGIYEFKFV